MLQTSTRQVSFLPRRKRVGTIVPASNTLEPKGRRGGDAYVSARLKPGYKRVGIRGQRGPRRSSMALLKDKHGSPIYERYLLDLLEQAKRTIGQSKERVAESKKLQATYDELLETLGRLKSTTRP